MGYTRKRLISIAVGLVFAGLIIAGLVYGIKLIVGLGEALKDNTDSKYEYSEPTDGAAITERRASERICSLDGSVV